MRINKHDTNGTKPLLGKGELGYDDYTVGGDAGRVYVGTGSVNIPQAKKAEVVAVDGKVDTHVVRIDNPHSVTKTQVGLGSVDNTSDIAKVVASAAKWTTSRSINGSAVDGTSDIITAQWGTSRDITIGNTSKSVNGDGNVSWTLGEIGAIGTVSPAFTGVPTAPTAVVNTSTAQIATTAFVNAEIANNAVPRVTSTDNAIPKFNGTTGYVQDSNILIDSNGNLNITGTGKKITGDFSNATETNKVMFQTSIVNSATVLGIVPNGTSTTAICRIFNSSDVNNSSIGNFRISSVDVAIWSTKFGTGSYLPLTFYTSDTERMRIDTSGNILVTGGGGLGYGTGSGGTVTQLTSKSTSVTLNKPSGQIITSSSALGAGVTTAFILNNTLLTGNDNIKVIVGATGAAGAYQADCTYCINGAANITIKNLDSSSRTDAVAINFTIIKGASS